MTINNACFWGSFGSTEPVANFSYSLHPARQFIILKDQKPAPARTSGEAEAQLSAPALISGRDRVMGARTLLDRDTPPPVPTERRSRLRAMTPPQADSGAGLFEHLPVEMLKDVAIFIAVFTVSCALMLTLSVYAF